MNVWLWIVLASACAFALKFLGYAVPARWLHNPRMTEVAAAMTVALLAALTVMNTFASGSALIVDARLVALIVAAVALWLRAPFLVVVVLGAASAAAWRWWS